MRVVRLHIPPGPSSLASAIYATGLSLTNAKFFWTQLNSYCSSMSGPFSLEFYSEGGVTFACIAAEDREVNLLTQGLYGWLQGVEFQDVPDYAEDLLKAPSSVGTDMQFQYSDLYAPLVYNQLATNCLMPLLTCLSRLPHEDRAIVQVLCRPIPPNFGSNAKLAVRRAADAVVRPFRPSAWLNREASALGLSRMRDKCTSQAFQVNYRVAVYTGGSSLGGQPPEPSEEARLRNELNKLVSAMQFLNSPRDNRFIPRRPISGAPLARKIAHRTFDRPFRASTLEVASLWHPPPSGALTRTAEVSSLRLQPPRDLPTSFGSPQVSRFGQTNFQGGGLAFGIKRYDRRRHLHILGQAGCGKSHLLRHLISSDIEHGFGCAVIDPHGDLADDILSSIPAHRRKDVVWFDCASRDFSPMFNPLAPACHGGTRYVANGIVQTFRKALGDSWSDKAENVLRTAVNALVEVPGANMTFLRRFLKDRSFRLDVLARCLDHAAVRFWHKEYNANQEDYDSTAVDPLLHVFDSMLSSDVVRNMFGGHERSLEFRELIDTRKIVLIKLPQGQFGSGVTSMLGSLLMWKFHEAAISRADVPMEKRHDFYLYIDDFQHLASEAFSELLDQAKQFRLCVTVAHQFIGQLPREMRENVLVSVGNILTFRPSMSDVPFLMKEFGTRLTPRDFDGLSLRDFYVKMSIDGEPREPFSGLILELPPPTAADASNRDIVPASCRRYCRPSAEARRDASYAELMSLDQLERMSIAGDGRLAASA